MSELENKIAAASQPPVDAPIAEGYWWCPECREEVDSVQVTYQECHDTCGRHVEWKKPQPPDDFTLIDQIEAENERFRKRHAELIQRAKAAEAKVAHYDSLKQFAQWVLRPDCVYYDDLEGGEIQDQAEAHGLVVATLIAEPCCEQCSCAEFGDFPITCYRLADWMKTPPKEPEHE